MKKIVIKILSKFFEFRTKWYANRLYFKAAIRQAENSKKRCYIYFIGGRYRVLHRKQIQLLKNGRIIRPELNIEKMKDIQLYDTQGHINSHPLYRNITLRGINIVYTPLKQSNN